MWTYHQRSGQLIDRHGVIVATGYSGNGEWKNKPEAQNVKGHGPLPRGKYVIDGPYNSQKVGPFALILKPDPSNTMFGRGDFRIHGDSKARPGEASDGCIIVQRAVRNMVWDSGDRELLVVE